MTDTPTDDQPGRVAEKPEHCFACCRLIRPGRTCYLTREHEVLCAECAQDETVLRVREDLAVEVKRGRLVERRVLSFHRREESGLLQSPSLTGIAAMKRWSAAGWMRADLPFLIMGIIIRRSRAGCPARRGEGWAAGASFFRSNPCPPCE